MPSAQALPPELVGGVERLRGLAAVHSDLAARLVLLEEIALPRLAASVDAMRRELLDDHVPTWDRRLRAAPPADLAKALILRREHTIFPGSIEQLDGLLGILANEPHGGHRQALGQYWRIFLEALERHLRDELRTLEPKARERGA